MLRFRKTITISSGKRKQKTEERHRSPEVPEGMWSKCPRCGQILYNEDRKQAYDICSKCGYYARMGAYDRIAMVVDTGSFEEWEKELPDRNPSDFDGSFSNIAHNQQFLCNILQAFRAVYNLLRGKE